MMMSQPTIITADPGNLQHQTQKETKPIMSTSNPEPRSPTASRRHPAMIIAMIPIGALLGFLGGLVIEIIVGLIARSAFSADHPPAFSWQLLGSLPGLGALISGIGAPILYARSKA
jgi:hypothetical protein